MSSSLPSAKAGQTGAQSHPGLAPADGRREPALPHAPYDVVIAGASFAGLAVALRLRGHRVALVDRAPLGEEVTSACAAPVSIVRAMHADASIRQVHDHLVLHTPATEVVWRMPEPFCTFDYREFCQAAFVASGAEFVHASVLGRRGQTIRTRLGEFQGGALVDATGWRAVLAGGSASGFVDRGRMAFGIESEVEYSLGTGLHFYFHPEVRDGYAWAFSAAGRVRFGVLSYRGRSKLGTALETFMGRFGLKPGPVHGGFLASGLRESVVDGVFVVGDASGHCLPLTGEGIRTAALGGFQCGGLLRDYLVGQISFLQAACRYRDFTKRSRQSFRALLWGNGALLALPLSAIGPVAKWLSRPYQLRLLMKTYLNIFADGWAILPEVAATKTTS